MKQIRIELIDYMGSDLSTVNSARVSFDKHHETIEKNDVGLIKYLAEHKHMTPFRHNQIQLRCHAPIFLARQLGKHQAGLSWNEVSRRYVDSAPEFYVPDEWRGRPNGSIKQGSSSTHEDSKDWSEAYLEHIVKECVEFYEAMIKDNVAPEMARMVLPQSMMTSWWWSGNLLAFAHTTLC